MFGEKQTKSALCRAKGFSLLSGVGDKLLLLTVNHELSATNGQIIKGNDGLVIIIIIISLQAWERSGVGSTLN